MCRPIQELSRTSFLLQSCPLTFCTLPPSSTRKALPCFLLSALNKHCCALCCRTMALLVLYPLLPGEIFSTALVSDNKKLFSRACPVTPGFCSNLLVSDNNKIGTAPAWDLNSSLVNRDPITLRRKIYGQVIVFQALNALPYKVTHQIELMSTIPKQASDFARAISWTFS